MTCVCVTGDAIHHPCQIARPGWAFAADHDPQESTATRRALLAELAAGDTILAGTHFPSPWAGTIRHDDDGYRFVPIDP